MTRTIRIPLWLAVLGMSALAIDLAVTANEYRRIAGSTDTVQSGGERWYVYADAEGTQPIDIDGDGVANRYGTQHTADDAANTWLDAGPGNRTEVWYGPGFAKFRKTTAWELIETDPPVEPPIDPDPQPPVEPGERVTIHIDAEGDDARDGRTPETAIKSITRAKAIAVELRDAEPGTLLTFAWERGDTFAEAFGNMHWKYTGIDEDHMTIFTGYGDGAKPHINIAGQTGWRSVINEGDLLQMSNCHWLGLSIEGVGSSISLLGPADNITIENCDIEGATVNLQKRFGDRIKNVKVIDTVIWNCRSQGIFADGIDGLTYDRVVLYRNGYDTPQGQTVKETADEDLIISTKKHGTYITDRTDGVQIINSFAIYNSGAGLQMRTGGELFDSVVAWNRRSAVDWGLVNGSPTGIGGKTGEVARNYIQDDGAAQGLGVSNIASGHIHHNILYWNGSGWHAPLHLRADWGPNLHPKDVPGAERVGLNNLIVEENDIYGHLNVQYNGWGKQGGDGVTLRSNRVSGLLTKADFDDPDGKLVVVDEAGQFGQTLPAINQPTRDEATIQRILNREVRAIDFIAEIKGAA